MTSPSTAVLRSVAMADDVLACNPPGIRLDEEITPLPLRDALVEHVERFPQIRVVRDYPVLRQIGEIRHRQYVERQGKAYASMVLDRQCLIEPNDFTSVNLYARDDHGITCTMRVGEVLGDANPYTPLFEQVTRRFRLPVETSITCAVWCARRATAAGTRSTSSASCAGRRSTPAGVTASCRRPRSSCRSSASSSSTKPGSGPTIRRPVASRSSSSTP